MNNALNNTPKNKQLSLFTEDRLFPNQLPTFDKLQPSHNLLAIFDDCHNYIYANEGLLKEKIFHEMVKLLVMKLHDEQTNYEGNLQFGITAYEYKCLLSDMPSSFNDRINYLFDSIKDKYKNLFTDNKLKLKSLTLANIIGRLQHINLTRTPGDIKGEAFQSFVYRHQRGDRGEFFTPYPIVKLAVEMIDPQPHEKLIDPACGSGGFLIQAISYVLQNNPDFSKSDYVKNCIQGIEFNPDIALSATLRIIFEGGLGKEITCSNTLSTDYLDESFDIILTNPPFGNKGKIEDPNILNSYILAHKWNKSAKDEWRPTKTLINGQSPDVLFTEKCLRLLKPNGRMAIVLPDGLLQNITNSYIRYWIRSQAKVLGVVSIPQEAFAPYGTGIKTSLLLLQKLPSTDRSKCFMAIMQKMGYDVKGQVIYKRDERGKLIKTISGSYIVDDDVGKISTAYSEFINLGNTSQDKEIYTVPIELLNSRLDVEHYKPVDLEMIEQLRNIGAKTLCEIADIVTETDDFRLIPDSDVRYIAISDVDSKTMQVINQQIIKAYEAPSRATYRVCKDDIITATSGASTGTPRQATALITEDEDGAICSNGFAVIRNIRDIEPMFLLAYMRTEFYFRQVRRLMTGHAIPSISLDDLSKVLIPVPSNQEQKKIAESVLQILAMRKESRKIGDKVVSEVEELINTRI
mgnify:CR=1 FL=1